MEEPRPVKIDVSRDPGRHFSDPHSDLARNYPGERIVVHVPFKGDADVFKLRPSSLRPSGRVGTSRRTSCTDDRLSAGSGAERRWPNRGFIRCVGQYLEWSRQQIESFNRTLEQDARRAIDACRQCVEQRNAQLAKSSIPMRRPGDKAKTYIPDVLVRRPAPPLPETRADDKPPELESVLDERVFEHILGIIRMQARQMEQSPGTYARMGEEHRRQTIVATLNTHYAGRAAAEAFNVQRKTDILIRHDGRNLLPMNAEGRSPGYGARSARSRPRPSLCVRSNGRARAQRHRSSPSSGSSSSCSRSCCWSSGWPSPPTSSRVERKAAGSRELVIDLA